MKNQGQKTKQNLRPLGLIVATALVFTACVSTKVYKEKVAELDAISAVTKTLKKEIKELEHNNKILGDTIRNRIARKNALQNSIAKNLAAKKVKYHMNPDDLKTVSYRDPNKDEWSVQWLKEHKYTDTNCAKNTPWLSAKEKKMYYYLNYARLNPTGFCDRYVLPKLKNDSTNIYLITLVNYMYAMLPMNAVKPNKTQYDNAKCHATSSGIAGHIGHDRVDKNCKSGFYGECISYGVDEPLSVVLQLLIDENVSSLGHRYICLGFYTEVGISMADHKSWGTNVVWDFI